jgi:hypothetical protein
MQLIWSISGRSFVSYTAQQRAIERMFTVMQKSTFEHALKDAAGVFNALPQ